MADAKISALTATTTLADTDEVPLASTGVTKKITGANLKATFAIPPMNGRGSGLYYVAPCFSTGNPANSPGPGQSIALCSPVWLEAGTLDRIGAQHSIATAARVKRVD